MCNEVVWFLQPKVQIICRIGKCVDSDGVFTLLEKIFISRMISVKFIIDLNLF